MHVKLPLIQRFLSPELQVDTTLTANKGRPPTVET